MKRIYEVTTILGEQQNYQVLETEPIPSPSGEPGINFRTLEDHGLSRRERFAKHAYHMFRLTGLEEAIKLRVAVGEVVKQRGLPQPKRLRLIHDPLPFGSSIPILRVNPIGEQQIYLGEYKPEQAKLPLENMTISNESEGSLEIKYTGLRVLLHLRDFEKENERQYGRTLRETRRSPAQAL